MIEVSVKTVLILFFISWTQAQTLNDDYRLPTDIIPIQYNISLRPYLIEKTAKQFTFDGTVTIKVQVQKATNKILLHSKSLQYQSRVYWRNGQTTKTNLNSFSLNEDSSIITYTLTQALQVGETYFLQFVYVGQLEVDMKGFYRSSYTNTTGPVSWLAATQFETNHARRAFPCWDEPHFKATYIVDITRPKFMTSYSNALLQSSTNVDSNYVKDLFVETPVMSTYLVAFLVGEFRERSNGKYTVIARPDYYDQTKFAFDFGQAALDYLSTFFDIPYYDMGIPKLYSAAIPDFSAGAMENWGLVTYRERALCYDEKESTVNYKQSIASILAHEQTHLWFGDLVTCDWWSYTWLNEGFAQFFQYMATAAVDPSLEFDKQFVVNQLQSVFEMDSTNVTNPINNINVGTPSLLSTAFNSITYTKGASFIRMVRSILGEEKFQKSLQTYLKNNPYKNTQPEDMFKVWTEHFPTQFKGFAFDFFNSFTWQVGYPLITVNVAADRKSFQVYQKRFLLEPTDGADTSLLYTVPLTYTTNIEKNFTSTYPDFFLPPSTVSTVVTLNQAVNWVIANIQEIGYYRVNYDIQTWNNIRQALFSENWSSIHELNRAQIVDDLFNLGKANEIPYEKALNILEYLETETNYLPWASAFEGFSFLSKRLGTNLTDFSKHMLRLTKKAYTTLGFVENPDDKHLNKLLRALTLQWVCRAGHQPCIDTAKSYYQNRTTTSVPTNIRLPVYCVAMRGGSEDDYNWLIQKYKTENVATEITLILSALGCLNNTSIIDKYVDFILTDDVRLQDKSAAFSSLTAYNNENVTPLFNIVTAKFAQLVKSLGGYSAASSVVANIAERFTTESQLDALKAFNKRIQTEYGQSLTGTESKVAKNLAWSKARLQPVVDYLARGSASRSSVQTMLALVVMAFISKLLF